LRGSVGSNNAIDQRRSRVDVLLAEKRSGPVDTPLPLAQSINIIRAQVRVASPHKFVDLGTAQRIRSAPFAEFFSHIEDGLLSGAMTHTVFECL
jgi:hypothetical protein